MSPLEVWCNESQERYVMAIAPAQMAQFDGSAAASAHPCA